MTPPQRPQHARRPVALVTALLFVAAFVATHLPRHRLPRLGARDTSLHGIGYFVLGTSLLATFVAWGLGRRTRGPLLLGALAAYAALDELTQPLVGRDAAWADWTADLLGAAAALLLGELALLALTALRRR